MKAQLNPFASDDAFKVAQKKVSNDIKIRFSTISFQEIEELVADAFLTTYRFQQTGRLTIPPIAFAKVVARFKAIDVIRRAAALRRQGIVFVEADFAREMPVYTEGGLSEEMHDDDMQFLLDQIASFIQKQKPEVRQLFEAEADALLVKMTDLELAYLFNFKTKTGSAVRKKRCDLKKRVKMHLAPTPQYQRLQVVYRHRQVA